jgi:hypothetical protein
LGLMLRLRASNPKLTQAGNSEENTNHESTK